MNKISLVFLTAFLWSSFLTTIQISVHAFVIGPTLSSFPQKVIQNTMTRQDLTSLNLIGYRNKGQLRKEDAEGDEPKEVGEIKGIDRKWKDETDGFAPGGEISLDVFYPQTSSKPAQGAVFFMHGFSQYPVAYAKTLQKTATEANVVVFAVETGITSSASRGPLFSDKQFFLQRAVSYDTIQIIEMFKNGEFSKIVNKNVPIGLCGHSMGGGLCFYVASRFPKDIDYVFAMAPAYGVKAFDPITATSKTVAKNALLLAGTWDLLAPAAKVEAIAANSNKVSLNSAIYGPIKRGLHTGFEDKLVIVTVPLTFLLAIILNLNVFLEFFLGKLLSFVRTSTGQLEIADDLMAFFFQQMVTGKQVTIESATSAVPEKRRDKITLSLPTTEISPNTATVTTATTSSYK